MAASQVSSGAVLEETFYIFSKKKTVYRVRLTEKGLNLQKESNGSTKTEAILLSDIVGCRCVRSRRKSESCVCRPSVGGGGGSGGNRRSGPGKGDRAPSYVDDNSSEQDENDINAYLHIYAYVMKKRRGRVKSDPQQPNGKRERTTITLRFRSFDRYEENLREAQRWRVAIKCLMRNKPVPKSVLCNGDAYEPGSNDDRLSWGPTSPGKAPGGVLGLVTDEAEDDRRLLVLLNPKSGPGKAREIFQRRVVPVLTEAEIPYDLHVTKHAGDARQLMRSRDLSKWSAIVVVGGDGLMFEVVNGMFERPDWETALATPVAVVPGGSGNGLAKSICYYNGEPYDQNPVLLSSLNIVKGQPLAMDLARVETKSQIMFSFLSIGWGFLSDIDIESERLRAMGGQRFTIWSVARLIGLRTYYGRLSYLPVPGHQPVMSPDHKGSSIPLPRSISQTGTRMNRDLDIVDEGDERKMGVFRSRSYNEDLGNGGSMRDRFGSVSSRSSMGDGLADDPDGVVGRPRLDSFYSVASRKSTFYSAAASSYLSAVGSSLSVSSLDGDGCGGGTLPPARMYGPASRLPALTQPVPSDWKVIEGEFVMVHASYQSHIGSDAFFAPSSKLADGIIYLLVVRAGITRTQLLQFLLGLSSGTHLKCPLAEMIPVRAFRLEPKVDDGGSPTRGHVTVDGELVDYGPLQVELVPSLARILSR